MFSDPGRAIAMDCSSPKRMCYFLILVPRWYLVMLSRISHIRLKRWGGKRIVMLTVSIIQPRTILIVSRLHSPLHSFLRETDSRRDGGSSVVKCRKIWLIVWRRVLRTSWVLGACPSHTKVSTKISKYSRGLPVVGSNSSRVLGAWNAIPGAGARDRLARCGKGYFRRHLVKAVVGGMVIWEAERLVVDVVICFRG